MNIFLLSVGGNLANLRNLLNWTQDDLCKKLGISRSYIVNMEKDPTRFDQTTAIALFSIVKMEIESRRIKLDQLKPPDLRNKTLIPTYLNELSEAGLTAQFLSSVIGTINTLSALGDAGKIATTSASKTPIASKATNSLDAAGVSLVTAIGVTTSVASVMGSIGAKVLRPSVPVAAAFIALASIIALFSSTKASTAPPLAPSKDLQAVVMASFKILETKVLECLGITTFSLEEFFKKIEEGKDFPSEDDLSGTN